MKIGGKFSITFPDCESLFYFLFPIRDNPVRNSYFHLDNGKTYGIWNVVMMKNRLEAAGFKVIEQSKYGKSPNNLFISNPAIHMICIKKKL